MFYHMQILLISFKQTYEPAHILLVTKGKHLWGIDTNPSIQNPNSGLKC
jgi:hypothetical protein